MNKTMELQATAQLNELCASVKALVLKGEYSTCKRIILEAMPAFPHAPQPHNLLGIVLEKTGEHRLAMNHFRAAWALDPTYMPANHNLQTYATFNSRGRCAFDESDI